MFKKKNVATETTSKFTDRQNKFIELYEGNGTDAARKAGYTGSDAALGKTAHDLLRNPKIVEAIRARETKELSVHIANRKDGQKFWTEIMNDETQDIPWRLKASELLGKSEGDFTLKLEHSVTDSLAERLANAKKRKASE